MMMIDTYTIAGIDFHSRLWACTAQNFLMGSHALSADVAANVIRESGTEILISYIPSLKEFYETREFCSVGDLAERIGSQRLVTLACTNLSTSASEAIEKAIRGMESTGAQLIKLEVLSGKALLDAEVLAAAKELVRLGYKNVIPFVTCNRDVVRAALEIGLPAVRVLASEIGSGRGIDNIEEIRYICCHCPVPVIVEGGIGAPADAQIAMTLGATAVLVNSAIVLSETPLAVAHDMKAAVILGREQYALSAAMAAE